MIDEAQRIKNAKSAVAAVVKSLERSRSWALTGTPLENRVDDLLSVLDFAAPGEFDPSAMGVGLRLTALTSGSFSGSHQATRLEPVGLPLALSLIMDSR